MRRGEAGKHLRTDGKWMRPSERLVFFILLERADNADCAVPAFMVPSLAQLADAAGYSVSATKEALTHLERHGWLIRTRSAGGRGRKSGYRLDHGRECGAGSPAGCLRPLKQADGSASLTQKQADGPAQKQADKPKQTRRSDPVLDEGLYEGEEDSKGEDEQDPLPPHWPLVHHVVRIVHAAPGGGLHRTELAESLGLPAYGAAMRKALGIAYRWRKIDFCGRYVVRPPAPKDGRTAV